MFQGSIKVDGLDIMKFSENEMSEFHRKKIGFVFQKFNLLPMLNVRENIVLPLTLALGCSTSKTDSKHFIIGFFLRPYFVKSKNSFNI